MAAEPTTPASLPAEALALLRCPRDGQRLLRAPSGWVAALNAAIAQRSLRDRSGSLVHEAMDEGLVTQDGARLYRVVGGIAVLRVDSGILVQPADRGEPG